MCVYVWACINACLCMCACMYMCMCVCVCKYTDPNMLPRLQVDKGAIRFILSGANIMCPGLTSPGARMTTPVPENTVVVSLLLYCVLHIIPVPSKATSLFVCLFVCLFAAK